MAKAISSIAKFMICKKCKTAPDSVEMNIVIFRKSYVSSIEGQEI